MTELRKKSIHDLRVMAQAFGVTDIFEKDQAHLLQDIELKQQTILKPPPVQLPPRPEYDARLMTKPPSRKSDPMSITELLEPYIVLGLKLVIKDEGWEMAYGKKTDCGTIRMPLKNILICAERLFQ